MNGESTAFPVFPGCLGPTGMGDHDEFMAGVQPISNDPAFGVDQ